MFASYTPKASENVEKILKSDNPSIEELMNEDDTINDLRGGCTDLIKLYEFKVEV